MRLEKSSSIFNYTSVLLIHPSMNIITVRRRKALPGFEDVHGVQRLASQQLPKLLLPPFQQLLYPKKSLVQLHKLLPLYTQRVFLAEL